MKKSKYVWLSSGVVAIAILGGGLAAQQAFAQSAASSDSLVAKIASRFNLKQSDVQAVFDQDHQEKRAQMEQNYEDRLSQAVKDGEITQAQKDLIVAKHKEIQQKMDAARTSSTDPKTEMEQLRTDLQKWASDNKIDLKWLMGGGMHRGGRGMMGEGRGMMGSGTSSSTSTGTSAGAATN